MSCPEREGQLALHAGGDLPPAAAAELRAHLAGCPACARALAALSETTDWLRGQRMAARMAVLDRPLLDELQRRIAAGVEGRRQSPWLVAWWGRLFEASRQPLGQAPGLFGRGLAGPLPAVAGAALLVLGVAGALQGGPGAPPAAVVQQAPVAAAPAVSSDAGLRIEMQTSDPDVRIIWFAAAERGPR